MNKLRRLFIIFLFFALAVLLGVGFYVLHNGNPASGHKYIGLAVVGGFFVLMPTFIYHRWKDRKVADYMLTDDALKRMKDYNESKPTEKQ